MLVTESIPDGSRWEEVGFEEMKFGGGLTLSLLSL